MRSKGPTLLILGAAKAGTTTLYNMLKTQPGCAGAINKEIRYFSMDYYYQQGPEWYHQQFSENSDGIKFEATPHYLYFPAVTSRVHAYQRAMKRQMKFIVLLREPVARSYSAWNMERSFHQNRSTEIIENHYKYYNPDIREALTALLRSEVFPSFPQAVASDLTRLKNKDALLEPSYVRKGLYVEQLVRWLEYFNMKHFCFIEFRELSDPPALLKKLEIFLDVEFGSTPGLPINLKINAGTYLALSDENRQTMEMLKEFYAPYNEKLFQLIGQRYDWND